MRSIEELPRFPALVATCLATLTLALSPAVRADEVRLADGRVLVGAVKRTGEELEITTRTGVVLVRADQVVSSRTDGELRAELRELAKGRADSAFAQLQLARAAFRYGLEKEMWEHLDRCLERSTVGGGGTADDAGDADTGGDAGEQRHGGSAVERQLRKFLAELGPEVVPEKARQADTKTRVRALVRQARSSIGPARTAAIVEVLAREPDADVVLRDEARREYLAEQRLIAIAALQRRAGEENQKFVTFRTLLDNDVDVRRGTAELLRDEGQSGTAIKRLAPGFLHDDPAIRIRAAEAYANLGDQAAVPVLVAFGPLAGTTAAAVAGIASVRAHMYALTSQAYIQDFDVEIAQAAAVANPVVGTLRSGVVLDVNVAAVITERTRIEASYRRALRELAGSDPGRDPQAWETWLADRRSAAQKRARGG